MGMVISSPTNVALKGKLIHGMWYVRFTEPLAAVASAFLAVGLLLTIFRLGYRIWLRRFWVEDAWAVVVLLCGITQLTVTWTFMDRCKEIPLVTITHSL